MIGSRLSAPLVGFLAGCGLLAFASGVRADEPLTNGAVASMAMEQLVSRFSSKFDPTGGGARVTLRPGVESPFNESFQDALAPALESKGYEVWILDHGQTPDLTGSMLHYTVNDAALTYPGEEHGFLSLGKPKVRRHVILDVEGRLEEAQTGRLLWTLSPRVQYQDRVPMSKLAEVQVDAPAWVGDRLTVGSEPGDSDSSFFEKAVIAGLLGGVVVLYVSGAQ